ncbi:hypothetical protein D1B17_07125 [Companilactobacillus zhachilii]|uniref:Helix-turn-helix domain-containing protein n=1 Tax=Companilactobacillus zhachilii TaxID=2304606 RepID=A0A386PVC2_9LACO|nr:hypothetical protein [Companilactobacillus zhachilii]AYE38420.1 hypothetical protein D1B17_07125 [Companilactobacillus zhachilii]
MIKVNDDNLAVYQMRENNYKLTEIAKAMHKELFYISDIQRRNNRIGKRLYKADEEWQELNFRRNKHRNEALSNGKS